MKNIDYKNKYYDLIYTLVYKFPTKYNEGFIDSELKTLLSFFPNINMKMFDDALMGNTCMLIDEKIIQYHCDIYKAIICGLEKRGLKLYEFD